jgi:hypothetical protein
MSWEIMRAETSPCECGAGTETSTFEMDDWNRTRSSAEIHCPQCREKRQQALNAEQARERRRDELLERAQQLAIERYLAKWLLLFEGMTKKAAWDRYTGGSGYPAPLPPILLGQDLTLAWNALIEEWTSSEIYSQLDAMDRTYSQFDDFLNACGV